MGECISGCPGVVQVYTNHVRGGGEGGGGGAVAVWSWGEGVESYKSCPGGNGLRYTAVLGGVA